MENMKKTTATAEEVKNAFLGGVDEMMDRISEELDDRLTYDAAQQILAVIMESIAEIKNELETPYDKTLMLIRQAYKAGFMQSTYVTAEGLKATYVELFGNL